MNFTRFILMLAAALVFATPSLVHAAEPLPRPDARGQWRVITADDATTTSRCIGNPTTPACAIETHLACFVRRQQELCDKVHLVPYDFSFFIFHATHIRLEKFERITTLGPDNSLRDRIGDIDVLARQMDCDEKGVCSAPSLAGLFAQKNCTGLESDGLVRCALRLIDL